MSKLTAIIIENELPVLNQLQRKLLRYCPEVEILDTCITGREGIEAIETKKPELVFLDIHLQRMTAFQMLKRLKYLNFEIIFTTGHREYALEAINNASPIGYLIKPIDGEELAQAVGKALKKVQGLQQQQGQITVEVVSETSRFIAKVIEYKNIVYLESNRKHTYFHLATESEPIEAIRGISHYENQLPAPFFCRIHRSFLVNLKYLAAFETIANDPRIFLKTVNRSLTLTQTYAANFHKNYQDCLK